MSQYINSVVQHWHHTEHKITNKKCLDTCQHFVLTFTQNDLTLVEIRTVYIATNFWTTLSMEISKTESIFWK